MLSCMEMHSGRLRNASLILLWKSSLAGDAPKNRTLNRCRPSCVLKVEM